MSRCHQALLEQPSDEQLFRKLLSELLLSFGFELRFNVVQAALNAVVHQGTLLVDVTHSGDQELTERRWEPARVDPACALMRLFQYQVRRKHAMRYRSNCASNAIALGLKSIFFTNAHASVAPCSRSILESSHSTLSGPW